MYPKGVSVTSIVWSGGLVQTNQHIPVNLIIKHFLCQKICVVLHLRRLIVRWSGLSPSYAKLNGCVVEVLHLFLDRRSKSTCLVMLPCGDFKKIFMPYGSIHIKFLLSGVVCASDVGTYTVIHTQRSKCDHWGEGRERDGN